MDLIPQLIDFGLNQIHLLNIVLLPLLFKCDITLLLLLSQLVVPFSFELEINLFLIEMLHLCLDHTELLVLEDLKGCQWLLWHRVCSDHHLKLIDLGLLICTKNCQRGLVAILGSIFGA